MKCLLSLYVFLYNDNKHFIIHEGVFLLYDTMYNNNIYLSLYKKIYNDNKHFIIHEDVCFLYETMYNDNTYFLIYESIFFIIRDDV